jgi:retron-type reverse transcriptase
MQLSLFEQSETTGVDLAELFAAYYQCRKNKRNTANALAFEVNLEENLIDLWRELNSGTYQPRRSIAFIIDQPVKREIFAADFRDRVVHHWLIGKLNPLFEKQFIYDSYACRVGKGTHFGINRADRFIRRCSANYTRDCFVLKLDIQGFFMHIDRKRLFNRLQLFIREKYQEQDWPKVLEVTKKMVFNDPVRNCYQKSSPKKWVGLPASKSLFHAAPDCGLPIGNLSSQVFANFYMDMFDHFVKHDLGIKYYGRYVDDFIIVHQSKDYLKRLIPILRTFLTEELGLSLHPKKIYLQHYAKGLTFLGVVIKPNRIYIGARTKGNFYEAIQRQNVVIQDHKPGKAEQAQFLSSINSYLGILQHYHTYNLRKKMLWRYLSGYWWNLSYASGGYVKMVLKLQKGRRPVLEKTEEH